MQVFSQFKGSSHVFIKINFESLLLTENKFWSCNLLWVCRLSACRHAYYFLIIFVPIDQFPWNFNSMTLVIEKTGYGVLIHDTKSLYARSKCSNKGTAFLLLFFILKSQSVYFIYFNFINFCEKRDQWGKPVLFKGM